MQTATFIHSLEGGGLPPSVHEPNRAPSWPRTPDPARGSSTPPSVHAGREGNGIGPNVEYTSMLVDSQENIGAAQADTQIVIRSQETQSARAERDKIGQHTLNDAI